jgi:outer membrane protein
VGVNGVAIGNGQSAYSDLGDGDFIDYILGAQFEMPIGNRRAEGLYRQRQIERRASALVYQRQAQDVVLEVKVALRNVQTSYELIGATRAARRAAADNLRALEVQEASGVALTPQFLINQKLSAQERLADAEVQEARALTDYHNSIAALYQSVGTILERNHIEFRIEPNSE